MGRDDRHAMRAYDIKGNCQGIFYRKAKSKIETLIQNKHKNPSKIASRRTKG
jgi:hypothetical protein